MQKFKVTLLVITLISAFSTIQLKAQKDARLMRFPDINKDLIAFVYAGDIWTVNADGGDAKRLTSHKGLELFPKISPDRNWIAFSAEYSGSRQVYVMPSTGGTPQQLTYYNDVGEMPPRGGWDNVVLDWTPDSKNILIRGNRTPFGERNGKYFLVNIDGGFEKPLQITDGGIAVLSPDATKLAFTPVSREFRTWKRYKGGRASDIWIYDLQNDKSERITDFVGTDQIPVWYKNKIYFASDKNLTLNIYSYDLDTKETKQITSYSEFDVMWPSGENGMIAYENGGFIYKLNLETGKTEKVNVNISFDNPNVIPYFKNVSEFIESGEISPAGNRAIFDARGDIFSVPAENGFTVNLTKTQGIREMSPSWSPNGKYVSYLSDATGEYEIYLLENKDGAKARQITFNSKAWKYDPIWSPDSKYLLFFDRTLNLQFIDIATGNIKVVTSAYSDEIRDYKFSPDSKWITYTNNSENSNSSVWVYNLTTSQNHQLTDDTFNEMSPVFSKDGNYIFFLSNRDFNLDFSSFEFTYLYTDATRIYALALRKDSPKLFKFKNDVVKAETENKTETSKAKKDSDEPKKDDLNITIDFDGIADRIMDFPVEDGNYRYLDAIDGGILYGAEDGIHKYDIAKEKDELIISGVRSASLSADGSKMLYYSGGNFGIVGISTGQKAGDGKLDLSNVEMKIDPKKEWNQIYTDGWRIFRDYFYVSNMHNIDWAGLKVKYGQLLPYLSHRADLDYILSEIISESNTGHAYDNYGDFERVKRIDGGLLGAELKPDSKANRYIISKIYKGENWNESRRSPLTEQGIDIKEGDYLINLNGNNVTLADNPYKFLENTAKKYIEITVNSSPTETGAKTYTIKTISSELSLFYLDWVEARRAMVDKLSEGRIGYIHVPNTAVEGNYELHRGMYAYHNKEALIIDDRYNGGGFIPENMADMLDRTTLSYWHRNGLHPMKSPTIAHDGPKAMLINGYSSSGGDAFPYYFKKKGLGTLIGTRTWGGLVGISGNAGLVDGGYIAVPRFGVYDENEEWIIEGIGVYPDIEVIDRPELTAKGIDPGIEKAVEVLLKELEANPVKKPKTPAEPDRSGWIEKDIK
ncbi:MAG TPA: acetyl-CoA synthetase [Bacteroidales bacterium]|nr:acetyl-CoA synthetase [Bacteroidales bacterium]